MSLSMKSFTNFVHSADATGFAGAAGFSAAGEHAASVKAMAAPASSRQDRLFLNLDVMCWISSKTTPSTGVVLRRPISKINTEEMKPYFLWGGAGSLRGSLNETRSITYPPADNVTTRFGMDAMIMSPLLAQLLSSVDPLPSLASVFSPDDEYRLRTSTL